MLNVKYLLHGEGGGPLRVAWAKKDALRISLFNTVERKNERSGPDQTVVD